MAQSRKLLTVGSLGVAAFALIGTGAGATFTDSVHASQTVTAGTLSLSITPVGGSGVNVDDHNLTLNPVGPVASSFTSTPAGFQVNNTGNITAHTYQVSLTEADNDANLQNLEVIITSHNPTASTPGNTSDVLYDGTVANLVAHPLSIQGDLTAAGTPTYYDAYEIQFKTQDGTSLNNADEGKTITPTVTVSYQG